MLEVKLNYKNYKGYISSYSKSSSSSSSSRSIGSRIKDKIGSVFGNKKKTNTHPQSSYPRQQYKPSSGTSLKNTGHNTGHNHNTNIGKLVFIHGIYMNMVIPQNICKFVYIKNELS